MFFAIIISLVVGFLLIAFPMLRCILFNPFKDIFYFCKDMYFYFYNRSWRRCPDGLVLGMLRIYTGLFGRGKTLSAVMEINRIYRRYNGKKFRFNGKWVTQYIVVLSNVELSIPYLRLDSLSQLTNLVHEFYDKDQEESTYTCTIALVDELGANLNSRSFQSNCDPVFINTLLTCRKYHLAFLGTSQEFALVDKLLRSVTQEVVVCDKRWRFMNHKVYRASDLESGAPSDMIKPIRKTCSFVTDASFKGYNTYAMVDILQKKYEEGDFIPESEIIQLISADAPEMKLSHYTKKAIRKIKRRA
ncbi:MAG: hypothetical protein MJ055_04855 [Phascolarctobacterium sp.]|nr:hypothetical protein [Phascolarctobacterium sp.]